MFYVVLELDVEHKVEMPKDHSRVAGISYQIINESSQKCHFPEDTELPVISIDNTTNAFQDAVTQLDAAVKEVVGEEQFVLVSLYSTWHIRVTLPREARDLDCKLPEFLEHPVLFDLRREFQRSGANSSDESITSSKVPLIKQLTAAFGIESTQGSCNSNVNTATKVLLALYDKCKDSEDDSTVLTLPYDAHSDYETFIERQSTAVCINNLPQDTTQSELESWFSQFGSRPIGFWTIRKPKPEDNGSNNSGNCVNSCPYVEEPDSVGGFIIYQTATEAQQALALNGRSILSNVANIKQPRVVEHVVEISPSCTSILAKAQDILIPFPQSKNKPRPGDWTCPSCGFSNFQRRTACFRCSFPVPNGNGKSQVNENGEQNASGRNIDGNDHSRIANNNGSNHYINHHHNNHGNNSNNNNSGSNVPFRAGDWKCASCTYHNFAKNVVCLRCNGPKTRTVHQSQGKNYNATGTVGAYSVAE